MSQGFKSATNESSDFRLAGVELSGPGRFRLPRVFSWVAERPVGFAGSCRRGLGIGATVVCLAAAIALAGCASKRGPVNSAATGPGSARAAQPGAGSKTQSGTNPVSGTASGSAPTTDALISGEGQDRPKPSMQFGKEADYLIGPGDVLEVIYQVKTVKQATAYRLAVQDQVSVKFQFTPQYDREAFIQTDGKVRMPLVGEITMAGKTTSEIEDELKREYSVYLKNPVIQVVLEKSNYAIEELKRAITTAPRGQSRLEPVRPDGYISLPLIGDVLVGGKTVPQASQEIVDKYRAIGVVDIDATVVLQEVKSPEVYVMGEVAKPGSIVLFGNQDVWRIIGQAGGFGPEADRTHVVVVKTTRHGETRHVVDFDEWKSGADPKQTVAVNRGDVIYVPKLSSRYVYILGEVEKPGQINLDPQSALTVSQAVALGGSIKAGANRSQVLVLRRTLDHKPVVLQVDLKALFNPASYDKPENKRPRDYALEPGDIVYVPPKRIGNIDRFAQAYFRDGIWTIIPFHLTYNLR